jgi:hypothetical protein
MPLCTSQAKLPVSATEESITIPIPTQEVKTTEIPPTGITSLPVHFWISNQSLGTEISEVQMTVSLDSKVIFDQSMAVEYQHNFAFVDQDLPSGSHAITVIVGDPYFLSTREIVDVSSEHWIVIQLWFDPFSIYKSLQTPSISVDILDNNPGIK